MAKLNVISLTSTFYHKFSSVLDHVVLYQLQIKALRPIIFQHPTVIFLHNKSHQIYQICLH